MDLEQRILDGVDEILGVNGFAVRDGLRHNPQQLDYAHHAARGFCRNDAINGRAALNMLQAATGLGKTIAYLVPALLFSAFTGKRVAISTNTRHLQRQILTNDALRVIKWIAAVTDVNLSIARRVGRSNYVSATGCGQMKDLLHQENPKKYLTAIDTLEELIEWVESPDNSGVLDDFLEETATDVLPEGIVRSMICLDASSPEVDCHSFSSDIATSKAADVLVVNHALMVMHAYRWSSILDEEDGRKISLIVFDEADRLPDVAESILSSNLSLHKLWKASQNVADAFNLSGMLASVEEIVTQSMAQHVSDSRYAAITDTTTFGKKLASAATAVAKVARLLAQEKNLFSDGTVDIGKRKLAAEFLDLSNDLTRINESISSKDSTAIISWSPIRAYPSLLVGNPDAGRVLSRLWRQNGQDDSTTPQSAMIEAALFTSATLATPGRRFPEAFDDFSRSVGIVRHPRKLGADEGVTEENRLPIHNVQTEQFFNYQPGKFGKMRFVLADPRIPNPTLIGTETESPENAVTNPAWLDYCALMIRTAQDSGKRTLVLTLSWGDTYALEQRLKGLDNLLVHHRREPLRGVLAQYRDPQRPNAVLLSPGAWEGVDEPGLVNNLVITRIPFLPPNRPEQDRERIHLSSHGYETTKINQIIKGRDASKTRRKLEQGVGRGLRSPSDKVTVFIADPRFPMPDEMQSSLDPVLMAAPARKQQTALRSCIPTRFLSGKNSYADAQLCLIDGTLHSVI